MKKIIYIIFPLLSFLSCNDFLDVSPQSNYTVDEGYKNQADFERAIAAVYGQQQVLYNSNSCWFMQINFRSDDARNANNISRFVDSPNEGAWGTAWRAFWSIINRSNLILDHIDNATFTDEAVRDHIKGEAYVMRAYAYWSLGPLCFSFSFFSISALLKSPLFA